MGAVQGFHRRGAHRRLDAQYDRFDRRHRLFRPEAARLACGFHRRKRRGRRRGVRFHGPDQEHADRRGDDARGRRLGEGASRHPEDPFRPVGSPPALHGPGRGRAGPRHRGPQTLGQAGRRAGQFRADRPQCPFPGTALVVRHAAGRRDGRGQRLLQPENGPGQRGVEQRAGRCRDAQPASGRAARPPRSAGQRHPHGLCRRRDRQGRGRRQRRGQRHAAGIQRLCLRLAAARRPPAQPRVRRTHHGPRSQPRLRLLRHGRPERLRAALRLHDGPAARRSGPAACQPPRLGVAALGPHRRCRRRAFARRSERPHSGDRRPLPLQRQGDRGRQHDRHGRELRAEQVRGTALGLRRRHVPVENQLPHRLRIPAPERVEIPADAGRRKVGGDAFGTQGRRGQRLLAAVGQHPQFQPRGRRRVDGTSDRRRLVAATVVQSGQRPVVTQGSVGIHRAPAHACHAPFGQRLEPRRLAGGLRLGRGSLCRGAAPSAPLADGRRAAEPRAALGRLRRHPAPRLGARRVPRRGGRRARTQRPRRRFADSSLAHHPRRQDVADFRPQNPARHRAGRDRQVLRDEPRAGVAARRRRLAQPRGFGDALAAQFRPGALRAGRRAHGLLHRGAHERFGGDEVGAARRRDHGRHPARQRGGQRHSRAAEPE